MLLACFISMSLAAQNNSTVNITVNGNWNKEVRVDGKSYLVNTDASSVTSANSPIQIRRLMPGPHSIEVVRKGRYNNTAIQGNTTTFNLRAGYDLNITVNNDGSVLTSETRIRNNTGYQNRHRSPMSNENFAVLVRNIQYMRGTNAKVAAINDAFDKSSNYFTTAQAGKLIGLVNSQSRRLNLAKASYKTITDPANFSQLDVLFASQASRAELASYVSNYEDNNPANNGNYGDNDNNGNHGNNDNNGGHGYNDHNGNNGYPIRRPMSDGSFTYLYSNLSNQLGFGVKMTSLTNEFNNTNNYFTTAQTRQLIELVSDDNNRLQLAKLAYNNVVDPENYSQINNLLNNQYSRNELDMYVKANNSNNNGYPIRRPMSDGSFTNLYSNISNQFGFGVKMTSLTNEFNNTNNYFTTAQARQLIQLVSDENNRLQLAKSSYDNIVDPENFNRLYDLFTSQSKVNELTDYVRSYSYNR